MNNPHRRLIVCNPETWAKFMAWGKRHKATGYRNRITVQRTIEKLLEAAERREKRA